MKIQQSRNGRKDQTGRDIFSFVNGKNFKYFAFILKERQQTESDQLKIILKLFIS